MDPFELALIQHQQERIQADLVLTQTSKDLTKKQIPSRQVAFRIKKWLTSKLSADTRRCSG